MFYFERMRDSYCVKSGSWERLKIYIYIDKGSKDWEVRKIVGRFKGCGF